MNEYLQSKHGTVFIVTFILRSLHLSFFFLHNKVKQILLKLESPHGRNRRHWNVKFIQYYCVDS
jgi:hypothetical protein